MGTTSSAPTRDSRGDLRQRAAQQAAAPRYNLPPGYADTPQPFNSTGNYAAPRYYGQPPPEPAPQTPATERTTRTTTIRNHVNLKKDSLKLIDDSNGGLICEFVFDANLPCWLSVFLAVNDAPREGSRLTLTGDRVVMQRVKRDAGLGQNGALKISKIDTDALVAHLETNTSSENTSSPIHSLVVRLECVVDVPEGSDAMDSAPAEPSGSSLTEKSQAQTTFATCGFSSDDDKKFSTTVTKQKIWVDGVSYELQDIFGIEHCSTGTPAEGGDGDGDGDDSGKECVVCMSEPRDTTALPCRHMCMCGACARMLRGQSNRCPICRTPVESLLEIKVATKAHGVGDVR